MRVSLGTHLFVAMANLFFAHLAFSFYTKGKILWRDLFLSGPPAESFLVVLFFGLVALDSYYFTQLRRPMR